MNTLNTSIRSVSTSSQMNLQFALPRVISESVVFSLKDKDLKMGFAVTGMKAGATLMKAVGMLMSNPADLRTHVVLMKNVNFTIILS